MEYLHGIWDEFGKGICLMFGRMLITAVSTAIFGYAIVSCGGAAGSGETLRWKTAVDVPVNFTMTVGSNLNNAELPPDAVDCDVLTEEYPNLFLIHRCEDMDPKDVIPLLPPEVVPTLPSSYIVDLGSGSVPTASDVIDILRKLDSTKIEYSVAVTDCTKADLTFYGMFFRKKDTAAKMSVDTFFNAIKLNDTSDGRVNMLGQYGLEIKSGGTQRYDSKPWQGKPLGDLIIDPKAKEFSYRWLVKIEKSKFGELSDTASTHDFVDIKLKIHFSGVNSIDSLLTL